jgi:hypothetical protein
MKTFTLLFFGLFLSFINANAKSITTVSIDATAGKATASIVDQANDTTSPNDAANLYALLQVAPSEIQWGDTKEKGKEVTTPSFDLKCAPSACFLTITPSDSTFFFPDEKQVVMNPIGASGRLLMSFFLSQTSTDESFSYQNADSSLIIQGLLPDQFMLILNGQR